MAANLGKELIMLAKGSTKAQSGQLDIDSAADIMRLQSVCVAYNSRSACLKIRKYIWANE